MAKAVDYVTPPVTEVVVGVSFERSPAMQVAHIGAFWQKLRPDYVNSEDQAPLIAAPQSLELGKFPVRVWFLTEDDRRIVQVQQDKLIFNWRRLDDGPEGYPEFETLFPEFQSILEKFEAFLNEAGVATGVTPTELELTYVNIVSTSDISALVEEPGDLLVDHIRVDKTNRILTTTLGVCLGYGLSFTGPIRKPDGRCAHCSKD